MNIFESSHDIGGRANKKHKLVDIFLTRYLLVNFIPRFLCHKIACLGQDICYISVINQPSTTIRVGPN